MTTKELINSIKLIRLEKDLEIIQKGLEDNVQEEKTDKDNIFKKFGKNVSNSIKKNKSEGLEKDKKQDEDEINKIKTDFPGVVSDSAAIKSEIESKYASLDGKYVFSILYLLSDSHEYRDENATEEEISILLHDDKDKISTIKKELNSHYNKVSGTILTSIKKNDALLAALEGYLALLADEKKEGYSYDLSKYSLSDFSLNEEDKKSAITMTSLMIMGKNGIEFSKDEEGENAFFELDKTNIQSSLAVRAYILSVLKPSLNSEDLKKDTYSILTSLSHLSLACQKKMIIDKMDQENAKEKLSNINNFISDLSNIL